MIVVECAQGSLEWQQARLGIPTASNFGRIVTPGAKASGQRDAYLAELLAEWALGEPQDSILDTHWIERGKALEDEARAFYELQTGLDTRQVGFVYRDERRLVGCSPDWLCDDIGGELKCPKASTHIGYLLGGTVASVYVPQVQGAMWVTGAAAWDFVSYYPALPPLVVRVERDAEFQAALDTIMGAFLDRMAECRSALQALGVTPGELTHIEVDDAFAELRDVSGALVNPLG